MKDSRDARAPGRAALPRARARYLQQSIHLEEDEPSRIIRIAVYVTVAFVAASIVWASVTQINEVVVAPGEVVAGGFIHSVEHLEGGIVESILVRDGAIVEVGDLLLTLLPAASESNLDQLRTRRTALAIRLTRLMATMQGEEPDFGQLAEALPAVAANEREAYTAMRRRHEAELSALRRRIDRQQSELLRQRNQATALSNEVAIAEAQLEMREDLAARQLGSRADTLELQARVASLHSEYQEAADSIAVVDATLAETRHQLNETRSRWRSELAEEAARAEAEVAELDQTVAKHQGRVQRLAVRAPVAGIVEGMTVNSINAVIQPGEEILKIIPIDEELIVESRVSTEDIGHVYAGLAADVKIMSYDPSRFGTVAGVVNRLSATTFTDEGNAPYFLAEISLSATHLGNDPARLQIIPGMTITADIQTGEKSVLEYLMKPISRGFDNAFHER